MLYRVGAQIISSDGAYGEVELRPSRKHLSNNRRWRDKFKGMFDAGWDVVREATYKRQLELGIIPPDTVLTPRPDWVKPWDSLSGDEKKLFAAFMENFAGYLAFADNECGRLLDAVQDLPDADNTLIFYIVGDNGASSEGGFSGTANDTGGEAVIGINGKEVGPARIAHTVPGRFGIDTFGLGSDTGSPVSNTYKPPFPFTGTVERVDIELGPRNLGPEDESKLHAMHTAFVGTHD